MVKRTHEEFIKEFEEKQPKLFSEIKIIEKYEKNNYPILVKTQYGICKVTPHHLLEGKNPTIMSSVNPTEYWINQARKEHGDKYNYSLVDYKNSKIKVKIIGKNGVFEQAPNKHLSGKGCPIESKEKVIEFNRKNPIGWSKTNWKNLNKNNNKEYKVYIIECWNETERFYKIGRTCNSVKRRFHNKRDMPYNYQIIKEIIGDSDYIFNLENLLKKKNKPFKYLPGIKFDGMYECFSTVDLNIPRELLTI